MLGDFKKLTKAVNRLATLLFWIINERISGIKAIVAKASIKGAELVLINTFLSKVTKETSFERQIFVIHTKKKIRVTTAVTVRKARISRLRAKIAKNSAR